jgi:hypothetical protein
MFGCSNTHEEDTQNADVLVWTSREDICYDILVYWQVNIELKCRVTSCRGVEGTRLVRHRKFCEYADEMLISISVPDFTLNICG